MRKLILALALVPQLLAQQVRQTTRTGTAFGDSSLFFTSDTLTSKVTFVTKAASLAQFRKGLSKFAFDSLITTKLNLTSATITGQPTWSSGQTFPSVTTTTTLTSSRSFTGSGIGTGLDVKYSLNSGGSPPITEFLLHATTDSGIVFESTESNAAPTNFYILPGFSSGAGADGKLVVYTRSLGSQFRSTSAGALTVGASDAGANPVLQVDASTASQATGIKIKGAAAAGGVAVSVITSGTNENLTVDAAGSGTITLGGTSTGVLIGSRRFREIDGTAAAPSYTFTSDTATGIFTSGVGMMDFSSAGARSLRVSGGSTPTWTGGNVGDLTVVAGTSGGSQQIIFQPNAAGTPTTALTLAGNGIATFVAAAREANGTAAIPVWSFTNSTGTGLYRFGVDTLGLAVGGAAGMTFPAVGKMLGIAGNMTVTAGTGASRTLTLQSTDASSAALNTLVLGADSSVTAVGRFLAPNASVSLPAYSFSGSTANGIYRPAGDTITFAINGVRALSVLGGAATKLAGGAGSMTVTAGTGSSRTMTLRSTDAAGTALSTLVLGADTSVTAIGRFLAPDASVTLPAYSFSGATGDGIYRPAGDTITFAINGVRGLSVFGGAATKLTGGAGNMNIQAGTGASRNMTLQSTNSASSSINTLVLGADSSATVLGKIVPNSTKGIVGTTTNDNANAGAIGEYISGSRATGSSLALTTATSLTVDSISLTAGDWDVSGVVAYTFGATTSVTNLTGGINTTTNVLGGLGNNFDWETAANVPTATSDAVWTTPTVRVSTASTIFVYLVAQGTFTVSTLKGYGAMRARRVR